MNYFSIKFSVVITIILFILGPFVVFAQAGNKTCSPNGYTITTINGISTDEDGAILNRDSLKRQLINTYRGEKLTVDFLHNPSHLGGAGDVLKSIQQGLFDSETVKDYDLIEMLQDASEKVATQKLLLVAHSQGNFYANSFYDTVADKVGGVPTESIGVYSVATPSGRVAGEGKWLTSDTDKVIAGIVGHIPFRKIMEPNTHIKLQNGDDFWGHGFSNIYLKYQGDKIISDIGSSLDRLKTNNIQDAQKPCLTPPELSIMHKIEGNAFVVADFVFKLPVVIVQYTGKAVFAVAENGAQVVVNAVNYVKEKIIGSNGQGQFQLAQVIDLNQNQKTDSQTNQENSNNQQSTSINCSFNTSQSSSHQKIIINEVAWMGGIISVNDEWIELKNISGSAVDLTGWQLIDKGEQIKIVFPNDTKILAGGFLLLERNSDEAVPSIKADLIYSGALSNTDEGLRLFDANCNLIDEVLANSKWPAGDNTAKKTMERNSGNFNWHTSSIVGGTPKRENSQPVIIEKPEAIFEKKDSEKEDFDEEENEQEIIQPEEQKEKNPLIQEETKALLELNTMLKISEVSVFGGEFVEIYNPANSPTSLAGYYFAYYPSSRTDWNDPWRKKEFPESAVIPTRGYYVIALGDFSGWADWQPYTSNQLGDSGGAVSLWAGEPSSGSATRIDAFGWGSAQLYEGQVFGASLASFASAVRYPADRDTDNNANDFTVTYSRTPGATDVVSVGGGGGGGGGGGSSASVSTDSPAPTPVKILISEVQISPIENRFIELYNPSSASVDLTGWSIKRKSSSGTEYSLLAASRLEGKSIPANGYFLTANEESYAGTISPDVSWAKSNIIAKDNTVILYNSSQDVVDRVGFGLASDCEGNCALNPNINQKSIQRKFQDNIFIDTDNNAQDFEIQNCPSPKAKSKYCSAANQAPSAFFVYTPENPKSGDLITFNAASSTDPDPDGQIISYQWDFGDNATSSATTATTTYSYSQAGDFQVGLVVFDDQNASSTATSTTISVGSSGADLVVISEIMAGITGNPNNEFVELYNPTSNAVSLSNWSLKRKTSQTATSTENLVLKFNATSTIAGKSFFLVAHLDYIGTSTPDFRYTNNSNPLAYSDDIVILYNNNGEIIDEVVYQNIEAGQSLERKANASSTVDSMINGDDRFLGNSYDMDNLEDFILRDIPNPQNSFSFPEPRNAPTAVQNFDIVYSSSTMALNFNWQPSQDYSGATSTITYKITNILTSDVDIIENASTTAEISINEAGRDYQFSIQAFDKERLGSATSTASVSVPNPPTVNSVLYSQLIKDGQNLTPYAFIQPLGNGNSGTFNSIILSSTPHLNQLVHDTVLYSPSQWDFATPVKIWADKSLSGSVNKICIYTSDHYLIPFSWDFGYQETDPQYGITTSTNIVYLIIGGGTLYERHKGETCKTIDYTFNPNYFYYSSFMSGSAAGGARVYGNSAGKLYYNFGVPLISPMTLSIFQSDVQDTNVNGQYFCPGLTGGNIQSNLQLYTSASDCTFDESKFYWLVINSGTDQIIDGSMEPVDHFDSGWIDLSGVPWGSSYSTYPDTVIYIPYFQIGENLTLPSVL